MVPLQLLRMIDANLNRSREGLRVLEDVARFVLDDVGLSQRLRTLRHDLARETACLNIGLLSERDAMHDVGRPVGSAPASDGGEHVNRSTPFSGLADLVAANAKRAEEALRVIEELARLPELSATMDAGRFGQIRFALYDLERELISRVSRRHRTERLPGVYVILDRQSVAGRSETDLVGQIIAGGASVVQLRDKNAEKGELLRAARQLKDLCSQAGVLFIVNDHLDLAMAVDADGIHLGQKDFPVSTVRRKLPVDRIVGCSVTTASQAAEAQAQGADYIAVGSVFPTKTKSRVTVVGLDAVRKIRQTVSVPLVAIGGIDPSNAGEAIAAGADTVAVISAVLGQRDARAAVQHLVSTVTRARKAFRGG